MRDVASVGGLNGGVVTPIGDPPLSLRSVRELGLDVRETPPPPDWLFTRTRDEDGRHEGMLRAGKVAMVAGAGGAGKSWLMVAFALVIATGQRLFGQLAVPRPGPVLLALGEEDLEEMHRRLHWTARALDLGPEAHERIARHVYPMPLAGEACQLVENDERGNIREAAFLTRLRTTLEQIGERGVAWRAVIIDPLSRFGGLETEVSNAAATRFVQSLETLTKVPGQPAVIVAHHTNKASTSEGTSDQTSARGASALVDGVRWFATLTGVRKHREAVRFEVQKSNYAARGAPLMLIRGRGGALRAATVEEWAELVDASGEAGR